MLSLDELNKELKKVEEQKKSSLVAYKKANEALENRKQGAVPTLPSSSPAPAITKPATTPITNSPVPAKTSALSKLDISGSNAISNMNKAKASVVDREKAIRGGSALGSMGLNTIGSIGKAVTATGDMLTEGENKTDRAMNNLLGISDELRKTSLEGLSPTGQMIGSTAMSLGESAMLMPTALINPYLYRSLSAAKNAGRTMYDKEQQGYSEGDAFTRGLLSGGVTFGTSKLGLDAALKGMTGKAFAQGGLKGAVANRLLESAGESLEGGIEYTADTFLDNAYGEDKKWTFKDFLTQAALEGLGSLAIGSAMDVYGGLNAIPATKITTLSEAERNLKPLAEREADAYREVVEPVRQRVAEEEARRLEVQQKAEKERLEQLKSQASSIAKNMSQLDENNLRQRLFADNYTNTDARALDELTLKYREEFKNFEKYVRANDERQHAYRDDIREAQRNEWDRRQAEKQAGEQYSKAMEEYSSDVERYEAFKNRVSDRIDALKARTTEGRLRTAEEQAKIDNLKPFASKIAHGATQKDINNIRQRLYMNNYPDAEAKLFDEITMAYIDELQGMANYVGQNEDRQRAYMLNNPDYNVRGGKRTMFDMPQAKNKVDMPSVKSARTNGVVQGVPNTRPTAPIMPDFSQEAEPSADGNVWNENLGYYSPYPNTVAGATTPIQPKAVKPRTEKGNPKIAKNKANTQVMPNASRYVDVYDRVTNAVNEAKATGNYDAISDVSDIIIKEEMKRFVDMVDNGATETDLIKEGDFWGEAIKNNKKKDGATKDRFLVFSRIKGFYEPTSLSDNYKIFKSILNNSTLTSDTNTTLQKNLDEITRVAEEQKKMADEIAEINSDVLNTESTQPNNKALGIVNKDSLNIFSRLKRMADKLYQGTVSGQSPLEKMQKAADKSGQKSEIDAYTQLARQAGGTVDAILEKGLYDSQGNKLNDRSFESIVKAIPKEKRASFNDYMQNKHNIGRMTLEERFKNVKNKDVNGKTADESRQIVAEYEKNNPEFVQYAKDLREFWNTFTKAWLVDTGVLSQEQLDVMQKMYPDYIPTFRTDKANRASGGIWGRSVNTPNNIKKATGATSEIVPLEESFATLIDRMVRAARKNDLGKAVATFADMDSELAAQLGVAVAEDVADMDFDSLQSMFDDDVNETLKQLENGDYTLSYYEGGKKKTLNISQNVFDSFRLLQNASGIENETKQMVYEGVKALTAPMKSAITGSNPVFALANVARDIQTYAINSTGNPVTVTSNWFKALAQTFTGSEKLDQYYAMGNSRSGYFDTSGSMSKSIENNKTFKEKTLGERAKAILTSPVRGANTFNERIETTTRYAEYLNNIKKYGDTPEGRRKAALAAADVTVNFSRSGPLTKTADAGTMYLNAGVQGLDNFARHLAKNPGKVALRGALSLVLPQLILSWWNKDNPNYKELNTRTKDTYFCIPNMADLDENGNAKTFIKLPKTQQYGVWFATFVDRIFNAVEKGQETGDYETAAKDAFEGFGNTVATNFSPTSPITGNIFAPIAINLPSNKDFAGRNIVSPSFINNNMPDEYQYDATTSNFAKRMAQITQGLPGDGVLSHLKSPQKIDYLLDSYTGIVGDEIQAVTAPENKGKTIGETAANTFYNSLVGPFKQRFIADPLFSSALTDEIYKNVDETAETASRVNIENNLPSDTRTVEEFQNNYFDTAASTISELRKKEQDILKAPGSYAEKQQAITENRQKMAEVARNFLNNSESIFTAISNDVSAMQNSELFANMSKEEQDKALDALYDYSAIKYRESFKPGYSSENDTKVDTIKAGDFTTAEAILYKQTLDNIKSKDEKADFIQQLDISEKQKDLLEDTLISDWITIPNEVDRIYTSGGGSLMDENYVLSGMGKEANKAWPILKNEGMSVEAFVDVANIMSSGKKKAEILTDFKELGYTGTVTYKGKTMDLSEMIYKTFKDKPTTE